MDLWAGLSGCSGSVDFLERERRPPWQVLASNTLIFDYVWFVRTRSHSLDNTSRHFFDGSSIPVFRVPERSFTFTTSLQGRDIQRTSMSQLAFCFVSLSTQTI